MPSSVILRASSATVQTGDTVGAAIIAALGTDVAGIGRLRNVDAPGLVIDESRTNLFLRAQAFHNAAWAAVGVFGGHTNFGDPSR